MVRLEQVRQIHHERMGDIYRRFLTIELAYDKWPGYVVARREIFGDQLFVQTVGVIGKPFRPLPDWRLASFSFHHNPEDVRRYRVVAEYQRIPTPLMIS